MTGSWSPIALRRLALALPAIALLALALLALALLALALPLGACRSRSPSERRAPSRVPTLPAPQTFTSLRMVTWNVLADPVFREKRVPALLGALGQTQADVIALQEVAPWLLLELLNTPWVKAHYHTTEERGQVIAPGGQLILSRRPIERTAWAVLPGRQRRTALFAHIRVNGRLLAVGTSHLESYLVDGPVRAAQLRVMFEALARTDDAVLLGDLNFGDGETPETGALDRRYVDLWRVLLPGQPGFTWDMARVPLARVGAFKTEHSRRLDRVLLRSARWRPGAIRLLGEAPVGRAPWPGHPPGYERMLGDGTIRPGDEIAVHPSDHLGLQADLTWR